MKAALLVLVLLTGCASNTHHQPIAPMPSSELPPVEPLQVPGPLGSLAAITGWLWARQLRRRIREAQR